MLRHIMKGSRVRQLEGLYDLVYVTIKSAGITPYSSKESIMHIVYQFRELMKGAPTERDFEPI